MAVKYLLAIDTASDPAWRHLMIGRGSSEIIDVIIVSMVDSYNLRFIVSVAENVLWCQRFFG